MQERDEKNRQVIKGAFWRAMFREGKWDMIARVDIPKHTPLTDAGCRALREKCKQECGGLVQQKLLFAGASAHHLVSCKLKLRNIACGKEDLGEAAKPLIEKRKRMSTLLNSLLAPPTIAIT